MSSITMNTTTMAMNVVLHNEGHDNTTSALYNIANVQEDSIYYFKMLYGLVLPIFLGFIAIFGFVGNSIVIIVAFSNNQMRNAANALIVQLAVADLLFSVVCVPFTVIGYTAHTWPFGNAWCKVYKYAINVTVYLNVYTLVLLSLDRYLSILYPLRSKVFRTFKNACIVIVVLWVLLLLLNLPVNLPHNIYLNDNHSTCFFIYVFFNRRHGRVFYGCFLFFAYVLPIVVVCVLYGFVVRRLLYEETEIIQSADILRYKKIISRKVIIVTIIFALFWLPIHVVYMNEHFGVYPHKILSAYIAMNCLVNMNCCLSPILYVFLSNRLCKAYFRRYSNCLSWFSDRHGRRLLNTVEGP